MKHALILVLLLPLFTVYIGCGKDTDPSGPGKQENELDRYLLNNVGKMNILDSYSPADTSEPRRIGVTLDHFSNDEGEFLEMRMDALDWYPSREREGFWRADTFKIEGSVLLTWFDNRWLPYVNLYDIESYEPQDTILSGYYASQEMLGVNYWTLATGSGPVNLHGHAAGYLTGFTFSCHPNWPREWYAESIFLSDMYGIIHWNQSHNSGEHYYYSLADSSLTRDRSLLPVSPGPSSETLRQWFPLGLPTTWQYRLQSDGGGHQYPDSLTISAFPSSDPADPDGYDFYLRENDGTSPGDFYYQAQMFVNGDYLLRIRSNRVVPVISFSGLDSASQGDTLFYWEKPGSDWGITDVDKTVLIDKNLSATIGGVYYPEVVIVEITDPFGFGATRYTLALHVGIVRMEGGNGHGGAGAFVYELQSIIE